MMVKLFKNFIVLIVFLTSFIATPASAQIGLPGNSPFNTGSLPFNFPGLESYMTLKTFPSNPEPNQLITVSLGLYLTDLNKAEISWFLNGELQKSTIGEKTFRFRTGPVGSVSRVAVVVDTFEGETAEKEIVIRPAEVDILWSADTYTPPFYKGKAVFTNQSEVTLTAVPNVVDSSGNLIDPKNLVYQWRRGNTVMESASGFGKNTLNLKGGTLLKPLDVRVVVKTLDESITTEERIFIDLKNPEVLVYENHPLYGIMFNKALSGFSLQESEIALSVIPYFFNALSKNSNNLEYTWTQNNQLIPTPEQPSTIILRQDNEDQSGTVNVGVKITDRNNIFLSGNRNVQITVGN